MPSTPEYARILRQQNFQAMLKRMEAGIYARIPTPEPPTPPEFPPIDPPDEPKQ